MDKINNYTIFRGLICLLTLNPFIPLVKVEIQNHLRAL